MTEAQIKHMHDLQRSGLSYQEIAKRMGVSKSTVGVHCKGLPAAAGVRSRAGLTPDDVRVIRALRGQFSAEKIARQYGVTPGTIGHIHTGRTWRHV